MKHSIGYMQAQKTKQILNKYIMSGIVREESDSKLAMFVVLVGGMIIVPVLMWFAL